MEIIPVCLNCSKEIPNKENYFFCSKCLTQVKCKKCSEYLEKDAFGCSNCGTPVNEVKVASIAVNNIEFEQNGDKKKFVANFTDHIGEGLVSTLSSLFLGTQPKSAANPFNSNKTNQVSQNSSVKKETPFDDALILDLNEDDMNEVLTKIFRFDGEKVAFVNTRLKQSGKLDHAIRISILTLYAHLAIGKNQVNRNILNDILNHAKVYDGNYRTWMSNCDEISKLENGELLELSLPGITAAKNILIEFLDATIEKGQLEFSNPRSKKRKKKKATTDDPVSSGPPKKTNNSKKSPLQGIEELIQEDYFKDKRRIADIVSFMKDHKATTITNSTLATVMGRLVKNKKLKREKSLTDGQYEYYK